MPAACRRLSVASLLLLALAAGGWLAPSSDALSLPPLTIPHAFKARCTKHHAGHRSHRRRARCKARRGGARRYAGIANPRPTGSAPPPTTTPTSSTTSTTAPALASLGTITPTLPSPWLAFPVSYARLISPLTTSAGPGVALTTNPTSPGPNGQSVATSVYLRTQFAGAGWNQQRQQVDGQSTWYHVGIYFPSPGYAPTTGQWNWIVEWHVDQQTEHFPGNPVSSALGVFTDYPVAAGKVGLHPHLVLRMAGGNSVKPIYQSLVVPATLVYNHWYSVTFHIVWSAKSDVGAVQWYVDGKLITSENFPTLFTNPDGTESFNTFGLYNYHLNCPWPSTVDFNKVAVGPTQASVGG